MVKTGDVQVSQSAGFLELPRALRIESLTKYCPFGTVYSLQPLVVVPSQEKAKKLVVVLLRIM